jgi:hypothetical protein
VDGSAAKESWNPVHTGLETRSCRSPRRNNHLEPVNAMHCDALGQPVHAVTLPRQMPKYRRHKASGQAVVTLSGKDRYLGVFGSKESKQAFNQRVSEWLASGCPTRAVIDPKATFTINDLVLAYWRYVKQAYSPQTRDGTIGPALRRLRRMYGQVLVMDFGPLRLKAYRRSLIDERILPKDGNPGPVRRLSRRCVNRSVQEKHFFSEPFTIRPDPRIGDAPPTISLLTPMAGASYIGAVPISWNAEDDQGIRCFRIYASYDHGRTWQLIEMDLPPATRSFLWRTGPRCDLCRCSRKGGRR